MTPVRLEPKTPWSRVKHSTTEPLRPLKVAINRAQPRDNYVQKMKPDSVQFCTGFILCTFHASKVMKWK